MSSCQNGLPINIRWKSGYAANVVLSHLAYPESKSNKLIKITLDEPLDKNIRMYPSGILVKKHSKFNDPDSVLKIIDDYAYKKTFLMNIGDEKGLYLENAITESNAKNVLELGVYLGYSSIRILKNLNNKCKLTSIESNKKFAAIANEHIRIAGLSENHFLKIGKSNLIIPRLNEKYDFTFLLCNLRS